MFRNFTRVTAVLVAAVCVGCVSQDEYRRALQDNENLREQRDALAKYAEELKADNQRLGGEVQTLGANAKDAAWITEQKARLQALLGRVDDLGEGISARPIAGGTMVSVEELDDRVLFSSGRADITPEFQRVLRSLVPILGESGNDLRIVGHTDSDPIKNSPWKTNLRLSSERAHSVVEHLTKSGIEASRMSALGMGQFAPVVPNATTDQDKRRNRRVEILILDR